MISLSLRGEPWQKMVAELVEVEDHGLAEAGQEVSLVARDPCRGECRGSLCRSAFLLGVQPTLVVCVNDRAIGVALDKASTRAKRHQLVEGFTGQRACRHIAADHDRFDTLASNVGQYGLQRRQVAVNVVQSGHPHVKILLRPRSVGRSARWWQRSLAGTLL